MKDKKIFIFLIISLLFLTVRPIEADMGPKTSVEVSVINPPEHSYYMTLLSSRESNGPWSAVGKDEGSRYSDEKEAAAFKAFAEYEDSDHYYFLGYMSMDMLGGNLFTWGYYPPDQFKVAICCPEEGTLKVSEKLERFAFNSAFVADYGTSPLQVNQKSEFTKYFIRFLIRVVLTILVEYFIAYVMGYRSKKERKTIIIVNLITQVILNLFLMFTDYMAGGLVWTLMFPIGELAVFVIELIIYLFALKGQSKGKTFLYTLLANVLSGVLTFAETLFFWIN